MAVGIPPFRDDGWLPAGHHSATWDDVILTFQGETGSRRSDLTKRLIELRDGLRVLGVTGYILLDGSYISSKAEPKDFDLLLVASPEIQVMKDATPELARWLDAERAEKECGYSIFYCPSDSAALDLLSSLWDLDKTGVPKGIVKVML